MWLSTNMVAGSWPMPLRARRLTLAPPCSPRDWCALMAAADAGPGATELECPSLYRLPQLATPPRATRRVTPARSDASHALRSMRRRCGRKGTTRGLQKAFDACPRAPGARSRFYPLGWFDGPSRAGAVGARRGDRGRRCDLGDGPP